MKKINHVYLDLLLTVALLFFLQSIAVAGSADLAVKVSASSSNATVGSLVTFNATLTNNGPDAVPASAGFVAIYYDGFDGLSIQSVNCHGPSPDTPACEYSIPFGFAVGQSFHMSVVTSRMRKKGSFLI